MTDRLLPKAWPRLRIMVAAASVLFLVAASLLLLEQPGTAHGHVYSWSWRCGDGPILGQGPPCDMPASGIKLRFTENENHRVATITTDVSGSYSIALPAGQYRVVREWVGGSLPFDAGPATVRVWPFINVTIDYAVLGGAGLH